MVFEYNFLKDGHGYQPTKVGDAKHLLLKYSEYWLLEAQIICQVCYHINMCLLQAGHGIPNINGSTTIDDLARIFSYKVIEAIMPFG